MTVKQFDNQEVYPNAGEALAFGPRSINKNPNPPGVLAVKASHKTYGLRGCDESVVPGKVIRSKKSSRSSS